MKGNHGNELIYHTKNSFAFYTFSFLLALSIIICLFLNAHIFVTGVLCFYLLASVFRERYNILVYSDRFVLREDFLPGSFMRVDRVFYYEDVKSFSFDTNIWKPTLKDRIGMAAMGFLLRHNRPKKTEKIFFKITYLNDSREVTEKEIEVPIQENNFLKAVEMIERRCKNM